MERFKKLKGWKGIYSISSEGYIRNNTTGSLRYGVPTGNYFKIKLTDGKRYKQYRLHRLVGEYFIPNPNNLPELNHKNGKKYINADWNLEWVTSSENKRHARRTGLQKTNKEKLTIQQLRELWRSKQ